MFTTGNDFDPDGDAFSVVNIVNPAHGTASAFGSGFTYTPNAGFSGIEVITYILRDTHGLTSNGLATVLVNAGPQPPIVVSNNYTVQVGGSLTITLSAVDPEGQPLTWSYVTTPAGQLTGSLSGAAPTLTYTAPATPQVDSFIYEVNDGALTAQGTIVITVTRANVAPIAVDDVATTTQETPGPIDVLANDTDADNDTLAISSATSGVHGQVSCTSAICTYTPEPGFFGTDSFTYTISDGFGGADEATVTVVTVPNSAPIATDQNASTAEDTPVAIVLPASDVDPADVLSFVIVAQPAHGVLSGTAPNVTYTPSANFHGSDSFTFKANDGAADSNVATVSINVAAVNDAPVAASASVSTSRDVAVGVTLSASDIDGDSLSFAVATQPTHGTLSGTGASLTYTPNSGYAGPDSFTYTANDGTVDSNVAVVTITVIATNRPPTRMAPRTQHPRMSLFL